MPDVGYSHRPLALGREGMVASAHPLATLAGVEVLKRGGTAADAAVAVNAILAVTQPHMCGVGGDLFCLYYEAASRRVHFLNGAGRSGSRAGLDELARRGRDRLPVIGPETVSVPGCVRAWSMLLDRFGTRPLAELLQPAIHYAGAGFPWDEIVVRGAFGEPPFAGFYLQAGTPVAVAGVNDHHTVARARRLMQEGARVTPDQLADPRFDLRRALS